MLWRVVRPELWGEKIRLCLQAAARNGEIREMEPNRNGSTNQELPTTYVMRESDNLESQKKVKKKKTKNKEQTKEKNKKQNKEKKKTVSVRRLNPFDRRASTKRSSEHPEKWLR